MYLSKKEILEDDKFSEKLKLVISSKFWGDIEVFDSIKIEIVDQLIKDSVKITMPNKKQLRNLYENETKDNISIYYTEYNKLSPNEKRVRTKENFILYYGKSKGIIKWNNYNKFNKLGLDDRLKILHGNENGNKMIKEWKKRLSISQNNRNSKRSKEDLRDTNIFCDEYWVKYGKDCTEEEKIERQDIAREKHRKSMKRIMENRIGYNYREKTPVCIEYWLCRGYSEEESEKNRMDFIKEKCLMDKPSFIRRYGECSGTKKYNDCIEKRKASMYKRIENGKYMNSNNSKIANTIFKNVIDKLNELEITDTNDIYTSINSNGEFYLADSTKHYYLYDFTIRSKKIIIEYNDIRWHPHPLYMSKEEWDKWGIFQYNNAKEKYVYDRKKINTAKKKGFSVLEIWNFEENYIDKCIDFIKENL